MATSRVGIIAGAGTLFLVVLAAVLFVSRTPSSPPSPSSLTATPAPAPVTALSPPAVASAPSTPSRPSRPSAMAPTPTPESAPAAPTTGTLRIESDVPDTSVFIDRTFLGTAPVTASDLTPGTHHLNMSATGYDGVSQDIDVQAGTHDLSIKFKEIRLDAKIAVVHKHAVGSCSGTLRATPQGLQYDTTKTDDAFSVPLTDIETFEVDYLNKNLRVKIRKGKTYNFTDPDGNADRLFVFQRDVEKVRQRLLAEGRS